MSDEMEAVLTECESLVSADVMGTQLVFNKFYALLEKSNNYAKQPSKRKRGRHIL